MTKTLTITEKQAQMLANLVQARDHAQRELDVVFTAIVAGHDIAEAGSFRLTGTELTIEVPE